MSKKADQITITPEMRAHAQDFLLQMDGEGFWAEFETYFTDAKYQGFNPIDLVAVLQQRANEAGRSHQFQQDMARLASTVAVRGTALKKVLQKSTPEFTAIIKALVMTYKIEATPITPQTVTLGRIGSCFAMPLVYAMHSGRCAGLVPMHQLAAHYPPAMTSPHFGAIIPDAVSMDSEDQTLMVKAYTRHQVLFDAVINRPPKAHTPLETLFNYLSIQMASPVYSQTIRREALVNMRILVASKSGTYTLDPLVREAFKMML